MAEIPTAPVTRLMRNAGAERVSEDVSQALVEVLEKYGENRYIVIAQYPVVLNSCDRDCS